MEQRPHPDHALAGPAAQRAALASPLRLEILALFGQDKELSVSDIAALVGRPATSLYYHLGVLEEAGILCEAGTRPKGKRFESLYRAAEARVELELDTEDDTARAQVQQTLRSAFRMAERDFEAALDRDDLRVEGEQRNILSLRMQMRADPDFVRQLNEKLDALLELIADPQGACEQPGPDDQFLSFTLALLPLRGRNVDKTSSPPKGDPS